MKKIKTIGIIMLMLTTILVIYPTVNADGPNYMGFQDSNGNWGSIDVTIGDSFRFDIYGDINSQIDTIASENITYLPAGIINYTSVEKGTLFDDANTLFWFTPNSDGIINNAAGYCYPITWAVKSAGVVNNVNASYANITWEAVDVGVVTLSITAGGTAYSGSDPGTTKYQGIVTVHPQAITGFTATRINSTSIHLSWTKNTGDDYTLIRYRTDTYPTSISDGTEVCNITGTTFDHTSLSEGQRYYYSAWGYNASENIWSITYISTSEKTNNKPILSNEDPSDGSTNIDKNYAQVSVQLNDSDGDLMNWAIEVSTGDNNSGSNSGNSTISCSLSTPLTYDATITWWVNVTDTYDSTNTSYTFTVRSQYSPSPPTPFTATAVNRTQIDLSWTKANGADTTYIERNTAETWNRGEGVEVYNNTGTSYSDTGLTQGTTYYYQAWSYNTTDNVWSSTYSSDNATTNANAPPGPFSNEYPANESNYVSVYNAYLKINCSDADGDTLTLTFYWGNGTAIAFTTINAGDQGSLYLPDYIEPDWLMHRNYNTTTTYTWYVIADDGFDTTQSDIYHFNTSYAWDTNEDQVNNYLDVSAVSGNYLTWSGQPGEIGADITGNPTQWLGDGTVNYLDVSAVSSHYLEPINI